MTKRNMKEPILGRLFSRLTIKLTVVCICCVFLATTMVAQSSRQSDPSSPAGQKERGTSDPHAQGPPQTIRIPDVEVLDQNGRKLHFYRDLIKGKLVVVNMVYTTCTSICPLSGESFARLQKLLGERLGRDVHLISVTIDPITDTPEHLKDWGEMFGARPGWTLVTGAKTEIEEIVKAFTGNLPNKDDHSPVAFLINEPRGVRVRSYGLGDSARWSQLIAELTSASQ